MVNTLGSVSSQVDSKKAGYVHAHPVNASTRDQPCRYIQSSSMRVLQITLQCSETTWTWSCTCYRLSNATMVDDITVLSYCINISDIAANMEPLWLPFCSISWAQSRLASIFSAKLADQRLHVTYRDVSAQQQQIVKCVVDTVCSRHWQEFIISPTYGW